MIVACGEALVDLMPETVAGETLYRPVLGGSLYNVALGVARLGGRAAYLWELSNDGLGQAFLARLASAGVDTTAVRVTARATPVALVDFSGAEPRYTIADPDRIMHDTVPPPLPAAITCLVVGSAVLAQQPVAIALEALALAAPLVAIDYNVRRPSITDLAGYRARLLRISRAAGIAKASVADLGMIGEHDAAGYMRGLVADGAALAVLTAGAAGAMAFTAAGEAHVPSQAVTVVDPVGAGDALMAALLARLQGDGSLSRAALAALGNAELTALLVAAQRVAAVTCSRKGAVMPMATEITTVTAAGIATGTATRTATGFASGGSTGAGRAPAAAASG